MIMTLFAIKALNIYSGCQKNVPIAERFFATTLMPPSFFGNINMASGIIVANADVEESARGQALSSLFSRRC